MLATLLPIVWSLQIWFLFSCGHVCCVLGQIPLEWEVVVLMLPLYTVVRCPRWITKRDQASTQAFLLRIRRCVFSYSLCVTKPALLHIQIWSAAWCCPQLVSSDGCFCSITMFFSEHIHVFIIFSFETTSTKRLWVRWIRYAYLIDGKIEGQLTLLIFFSKLNGS